MRLITTLTATVKGRASSLTPAATSPASYAAVPAARASGSALQPLDPAMLARELVIVVVDVATRRLRRSVPHDPLQPRKLRLRRRQGEPPECVPERVRLRLLTGMSAASVISPTILITALVDSFPSASGNEAVAPAPAKPREQKWIVGQLGDLVAQLPPALECVDDV